MGDCSGATGGSVTSGGDSVGPCGGGSGKGGVGDGMGVGTSGVGGGTSGEWSIRTGKDKSLGSVEGPGTRCACKNPMFMVFSCDHDLGKSRARRRSAERSPLLASRLPSAVAPR